MSDPVSRPLLPNRYDEVNTPAPVSREQDKPSLAPCYPCIVLFTFATIGAFTAAPVCCYLANRHSASVTLGAGDVWSVAVQEGSFSGLFCESYSVRATIPDGKNNAPERKATSTRGDDFQPGREFSVYALQAEVNMTDSSFKREIHEHGTVGTYAIHKYFVYHVAFMGYIDVRGCSNHTGISVLSCDDEKAAQIFIEKGPDSVPDNRCSKRGTECNSFNQCGELQYACTFFPNINENNDKTMYPLVLVVYRTGNQRNEGRGDFQIQFDITGRTYSLNGPLVACDDAHTSCDLSISTDISDIVLQLPINTQTNPTHLNGVCSPRVALYIAIFGGGPLFAFAVFGGLLYLCCKSINVAERTQDPAGDRRQPPPPPSYFDCISTTGNVQA